MTWAAVILTGGTAARLGGIDKGSLEHAGRSLLMRALDAVAGASEIIVVGPEAGPEVGSEVGMAGPVRFAREDPPGGGPLAGTAAGVAALTLSHDLVVVLAVDMPHVTAGTIARILAAAEDEDVDAAWLTDSEGRRQLAGAVRPSLVPPSEDAQDGPMRRLMTAGTVRDVAAIEGEAEDIDTWEDVLRLSGDEPPGVARPDRT
ncbi:molybdenum cofactor guanylyltransferase [Nocardioides sp.]|uniref:molybdenum cofactor guanylyltransferase n=1 Tax=Nocardioides sp. TaxID=35761 RepID=UPI002F424638